MLQLLKTLFRTCPPAALTEANAPPVSTRLQASGTAPFELADVLDRRSGLPVPDWDAVQRWVATIPSEAEQAQAWGEAERAWLGQLGAALGPGYRLRAQGTALLLSSLPPKLADTTLSFVNKTVERILRVLDGVALSPAWGHDILIVFDDPETYYRYAAHYYPDAGEFALSSGMYIQHGCGHFVTVQTDLLAVEPVIAHELTHACLGHLPLPAWLNEGLAVNTEQRLCPPPGRPPDAREIHARHQAFWGPAEIQQFWSGKSFLRPDEGNELSYDLARILVAQFASDWPRFRPFALAAERLDGGAAAALAHLGLDLGTAACAVLEREPTPDWAPQPERWVGEAERGAF